MIVFVNFSGNNPIHALGGLLLCVVFNLLFDFLSTSRGNWVWLELAASVLGLVVTGLVMVLGFKHLFAPGGRAGLMQFTAGFFGGGNAPQHHQQQTAQQRQQRWDKVVRTLQQLPTDTVATAEELQKLTAHELKERLTRAGVSCSNCLEKDELVRMLLEVGGSSAGSCCICCEDYASGDVVRVLPCKHRFHIECVDKWFLSSTDYSRPPACPMCNAELKIG